MLRIIIRVLVALTIIIIIVTIILALRYFLSLFGLLYQNTIDWVTCTQQKFISHSSGSWGRVQNQGAGRSGVSVKALTQKQLAVFSPLFLMVVGNGALWAFFYKSTKLTQETRDLMT